MDGVELAKRKMNISHQTNIEQLRQHAIWLLEQCWMLGQSRPAPDNYRVEGWGPNKWVDLVDGTKDYCRGWYEARESEWGYLQIACGDFVVWPEEWYALSAELFPEEKDKIAAELEIQS
jgi:hypothetical protein